tara:strand:- start:742 stop:1098 length:357 start_codon:yes stop_codon:yes gene_type:complete
MITQEFLSQCSDEQINRGVAWLRIMELSKFIFPHDVGIGADGIHYGASIGLLNVRYCANPNDIMPIASANRIDIKHDYDVLESVTALIGDEDNYLYWATNTNPLRAICEVYILMSANR